MTFLTRFQPFVLALLLLPAWALGGGIKATITDKSPTGLTDTSVTVQAVIGLQGDSARAHVEYGLTSALELASPSLSTNTYSRPWDFGQTLTGLQADTLYYYRVVVSNTAGDTLGNLASFRTATVEGKVNWILTTEDVAYSTGGFAPVIAVLANDISATSAPLFVSEVLQPAHGHASLNQDNTVTYTPGASYAGTDSFQYIVIDNDQHKAFGQVTILGAFQVAKGQYSTLLGTSETTYAGSGQLRLQISATGALTGHLRLGGTRYPLQGDLQVDGTASFSTTVQGSTLAVRLRVDPATRELTGSVTGPAGISPFNAEPMAATALGQRGRYTLLLPPVQGSTDAQGVGYATLQVSNLGSVQIIGRTGTGTPFTSGSRLDASARFPLYADIPAPAGTSLHGTVQFREREATSDCDGTIGWSRNLGGAARQSPLIGSRYLAVAPSEKLRPLDSRPQNATLSFGRGSFPLASDLLVILSGHRVTASGQIPRLALDVRTGIFAGELMIYGHRAPFRGILLQKQNSGAGVLKSSAGYGYVKLSLLISRS